jgi:hypothetical protein
MNCGRGSISWETSSRITCWSNSSPVRFSTLIAWSPSVKWSSPTPTLTACHRSTYPTRVVSSPRARSNGMHLRCSRFSR